jgi:hypothetical protein
MATKAKAKTPAINATAIGRDIGLNIGVADASLAEIGKATEAIKAGIKNLRDAKIKLGASRRTCAVSAAIYDAMPDTLAVATRNQYLSGIRKAVNEGKTFSMNGSRKAGGKKGAKTGSGTIMISLAAGDKPETAAAKLRKGFEKMRAANDGLASLAAFLVDALDEAGFPEDAE